ncbi:MAG: hypothetical protein R2940_14645 [Syntrophotaleaceae bacterium]
MGFNPLDEKGMPLEKQFTNWSKMNVKPYDKNGIHPYSRCRLILMNGAEFEANWFGHQFARHADAEIKRKLALTRRAEQQQQKMISWRFPADETVLETTIGYEQVAVDLTAYLARTEPDPLVKSALDFALLEDFDHLYRYANLMDMTMGKKAAELTGEYTEITVGRPTVLEHRHPFDEVRNHFDGKKAEFLTKLHAMTILAAEQQTMNFYMNVGNRPEEMLGRGLYMEIAQIEEQHVTHYESLLDPSMTWCERLVMHEYNECYLYYSCLQSETDSMLKQMWQEHLDMEIAHLHAAIDMMKQVEKRDAAEFLPKTMPEQLTIFESNIDYVRQIIAEQSDWTADGIEYKEMDSLPKDHRYWKHQDIVNAGGTPSVEVVKSHIERRRGEYRQELKGPHNLEKYRAAH